MFIHASDGNNAALAHEVEGYAVDMGHTVEHVSLNAYDFPVYTVAHERPRRCLRAWPNSSR